MRRHTPQWQLGLYAIFLMVREAQITDSMIDLLVDIVHKIGVRSKRKAVAGIAHDIEKVYGKERLLFDIAGVSVASPEGRVCDVIFRWPAARSLWRSSGNIGRKAHSNGKSTT